VYTTNVDRRHLFDKIEPVKHGHKNFFLGRAIEYTQDEIEEEYKKCLLGQATVYTQDEIEEELDRFLLESLREHHQQRTEKQEIEYIQAMRMERFKSWHEKRNPKYIISCRSVRDWWKNHAVTSDQKTFLKQMYRNRLAKKNSVIQELIELAREIDRSLSRTAFRAVLFMARELNTHPPPLEYHPQIQTTCAPNAA
jgi:hypothetical protein